LPSEGEILLPAQSLIEHLAVLDAAVASQTAATELHLISPRQQFAAARHSSMEYSLGEVVVSQQPPKYSDANGSIVNQPQAELSFVLEAGADDELSSGSFTIFWNY